MILEAVVAGHLCLDIIPTFPDTGQLPGPGQLVQVGAAIFSTGGSVANTGLALHIFGVETELVGKVGADVFGRAVLELIRSRAPELVGGIIVTPGEATSYTLVLNVPGRDRSFLYCPGVNDTFGAADLNLETVAGARLFHLGYPPLLPRLYAADGAELLEVLKAVKSLGVTTSLDMVMVEPRSAAGQADWGQIMRAALPYVDVFLPSVEEMLLLLKREEYESMCERGLLLEQVTPGRLHELGQMLLAWGARIVGVKLGPRGLYLRTAEATRLSRLGRAAPRSVQAWANRELWAPCYTPAQFVGSTGAGDVTIAGFLASLLAGSSPEDAVRFACAAGACNVEAADALGGLRSWDETWARLRAGWPNAPLDLADSDWHFQSAQQLWFGPADSL